MAVDTKDALVQLAKAPPQPHLLGLDAEGWVYVGLTLFLLIAIFLLKAPKLVTRALDDRIANTRRSLDDAKRLREEAEALLADAKRRQAEAHKDAEAIMAHAQVEAGQIVDKARADIDTLIARRGRMAEEKIAAAERTAIADVRARTASAAATAAATVLAARHDSTADAALIDRTIASLG